MGAQSKEGRLSCNARSSSPSFYLHSPRTPPRKNIAAMAVAILLAHTMATTRGATIITADGPTTRAHAMARSGVTLARSGVNRGVEDGRSVSIDRDDKKLKVYLEYTKMRALAFITKKYPSATSVTQAECASTLFTNTLRPKALHLLTVAPRGAHR